jgi:hypothetical protein
MWWKNYLLVFIVTSVLVLVTMISCNTAEKGTTGSEEAVRTSFEIIKAPATLVLTGV